MPNINTTSITPQERFAQTTVSYEKRDIMALPFYEGVEHKARIRGIMTMAILIGVIVGAICGALFGLRDPIIDFIKSTPLYTAIAGNDVTEEVTPPADEEMNVSLAADYDGYVNRVVLEATTVTYNGQPQQIKHGMSQDISNLPGFELKFFYTKDGDSTPPVSVDVAGWPSDAGTYVVIAEIYMNGVPTGEDVYNTLTINKATIPNPGIVIGDKENNVYNNVAKTLDIENGLPLDLNTTPKFAIELSQTNAQGQSTGFKKVSEIKNAGTYRITLTVPGNKNYETTTYPTVTYVIEKARVPAIGEAFVGASHVYDGTAKTIVIDPAKLPSDFPADLKDELTNGDIVNYSILGGEGKNVGNYKVKAQIDSYNYTARTFEANLEITKADLTKYFTFNDATVIYNGLAVPKELREIVENNFPDVVAEGIHIIYEYYKGTNISASNKINAANIIDAGTYTAIVKFAVGPNFSDVADQRITITINKADIDASGIKIKKKTATYTGAKISLTKEDVTGVPEGITVDVSKAFKIDAGSYNDVIVTLTSPNHNTLELKGKIQIDKAEFDSGITAAAKQSIAKDGKSHLPAYKGELPEGMEINFYVGSKPIEGLDKLGEYNVKIVVSDKNHEHVIPVAFSIDFNPLSIVLGIVVALPIAILAAVFTWLSYRLTEKKYAVHFYKVTRLLNRARGGARGGIICQSCSWVFDRNDEFEIRDFPWFVRPRFGRLYLTHSTLEFYDINYIQNYKNVILQLRDVSAVEIRGILRGKLIVFTTNGRHEFYVEPNTAFLWRRDIIHFRNLAHHHPVENYMVDNNYPFKYEVFTDGDWPPETRADVKKIKDLNKK